MKKPKDLPRNIYSSFSTKILATNKEISKISPEKRSIVKMQNNSLVKKWGLAIDRVILSLALAKS